MKNKLLLILIIGFSSTTSLLAEKDIIFAPYDPSDELIRTTYKMFLNIALNLANRIVQAPVDVAIPVATHEIAYIFDKHVIKKSEYKEAALKVETQQNELETQKKLNIIKIDTAQDKLAQLKIDMALQLQKAKMISIEKDNTLSEEQRAEKIKIEKIRLEQMQTKFIEHLSGKAIEGSSSVKENPAVLPNPKNQEQNSSVKLENTTINTPVTEANQTPASNTPPMQQEVPVVNPVAG